MSSIMSVNKLTSDVVRPSAPSRAAGSTSSANSTAAQEGGTQSAQQAPSGGDLQGMVKELNSYVQSINRSLEFSVDEDANRTVIRVVDTQTGELVRQIPTEEVLQVARHLREMEQVAEGSFFQAQV